MSTDKFTQKTRTLIVHKDESGYGLTLSGDKPTRVQTVRISGASHRAGVREGDVIIKVNGQQVTDSDHNEVVKLIQTGSYVALTVVHTSRILDTARSYGSEGLPGTEYRRESCRSPDNITGPQPVSEAIQKKTQSNNLQTIHLMIEEKTREIEEMKSQLARSNSKKLKKKLESAEKILAELEARQVLLHSPDKIAEHRSRFGPLPPTPAGGVGMFTMTPSPLSSSASSSTPSTRLSSISDAGAPIAPPRNESLLISEGVPPPPLPARNTAPTPPPRNLPISAGLPPPPPKIPRHNSHENISQNAQNSSVGRRGSQMTPTSPAKDIVHTRARSSPCSLEQTLEVAKSFNFSGEGGTRSPRYETPPGTPPPPYNPPDTLVTWDGLTGSDIMTMEDESDDDHAQKTPNLPPEGDHGPFNSLQELLQQGAHLSVFLNYVISNADPAPLLFYLITDAYKQGSPKEMRKWAYEIHSCFLVPRAPLEIPNLETQVIGHIDNFLAEEQEREENLIKLFWKVRSKARDVLKFQLDAFRAKRAAGMGNIFGPSEPELKASEDNVSKRHQIIEDTLLPLFDTMADDFENATDRQSTLCSALATVLVKTFSIRNTQAVSNIEKIPMFVSKEKKREKIFGLRVLKKNLTVKGHNFVLRHYDQLTYCNQSQDIIWGIGPQGYRCQNCDFDVHKKIVHQVEESCVGPSHEKKKRNRASLLNLGFPSRLSDVGRIMSKDQLQVIESGRKPSSVSPSPSLRGTSDLSSSSFRSYTNDSMTSEDQTDESSFHRSGTEGDSRMGLLNSAIQKLGESQKSDEQWAKPEKTSSIKRSESAKDGNKRQQPRPYQRKHSDPNLGQGGNRLSLDEARVSKSGSSSSSSLAERLLPVTDFDTRRLVRADSDIEPELDPPDWRTTLSQEKLSMMTTKEQKRQDIINELFHTERNHVRNIRILDSVFRKPLLESGLMPREMVDRLFPSLDDVLNVHQSYSLAMRDKEKKGFPIGPISDILEGMFIGAAGDRLMTAGSEFTQNQKFTIEELKKWRGRDPRLDQFLCEQEKRPECRRLQLQSQLPCQHQRLVKYPLLLEQLAKHCDQTNDKIEYDKVKAVTARTREILNIIDKKVAMVQNAQKLVDIQRNLDTSGLEKMGPEDPICKEYRNIDLTKHMLIYDGLLNLSLGGENKRTKSIALHVLLLEDSIMFLQKQDEKFLLKFHTGTNTVAPTVGRDDAKQLHVPVIKFKNLLVRPDAIDKKAFYLVNNTTFSSPQMNKMVASSRGECQTWLTNIGEAAKNFISKQPKNNFRTSTSITNMSSFSNGGVKTTYDPPVPGKTTSRSQSFQAGDKVMLRKDSIQFRPLPTPPPPDSEAETVGMKILKLGEKDEEIARALEEKQKIIAEIFNIPPEEYDSITDIVQHHEQKNDPKDVLLTAMAQVDNLDRYISDALQVEEEEEAAAASSAQQRPRLASPPSDRLLHITESLKTSLRALLGLMQEAEAEAEDEGGGELPWSRQTDTSDTALQKTLRELDIGSRSRPNSFLSLGSDSVDFHSDDGNRSDCNPMVDLPFSRLEYIPISRDAAGDPSDLSGNTSGREATTPTSTPAKDTTPTNESLGSSVNIEDSIDGESAAAAGGNEPPEDIEDIGEIGEVSFQGPDHLDSEC